MEGPVVLYAACLLLSLACGLGAVLVAARMPGMAGAGAGQRSFADLLDYAVQANERTIVLKSGALMQVFELIPQDLEYRDERYREHLHELLHKAVGKLAGSWCVSVDIKRKAERGYVPFFENDNEAARYLDERRAECFYRAKSYSSRFYLTVTFLGYLSARSRLEKVIVEEPQGEGSDAMQYVHKFEERVQDIISTVAHTAAVRPLISSGLAGTSELLGFISSCITGEEQLIGLPRGRFYLDAVLSHSDFCVGTVPKIGDNYIKVVSIDCLPRSTYFLMLNALNRLHLQYRFSHRFCCYDSLQQAVLMEKMRRFWKQRSKGIIAQVFNFEGRQSAHASSRVDEIDEAKARADNQEISFGAYSGNIILYARDVASIERDAKALVSELENLGFSPRVETVNTVEAYLGSLPGHMFENVRRPAISSEVFVDLLALNRIYQGEASCPNPLYGEDKSPLMQCRLPGNENFYLNLHQKDLGNTLVVGPPGSGKSVLLGSLMLNLMRYRGMRIFAFDRGYSFYALNRALEGSHIDFRGGGRLLCPLGDVHTTQGQQHALQFVLLLCHLQGIRLTQEDTDDLIACLRILAKSGDRSLSDLHLLLQSPLVKQAVAPYTLLCDGSSLMDGKRDLEATSPVNVFELKDIYELPERYSLPVLKHIFYMVEKSLNGDPCAIVLDEAWLMLRDSYFASELLKWFKTLRKHNAIVIMATQSLHDLKSSELFENLLDCVKTRIFLPNLDAGLNTLKGSYALMGLGEEQIAAIARGRGKHDYFFFKDGSFANFRLVLSNEEKYLLSVSGDHMVGEIDALYDTYGKFFFKEKANVF